MRKNLPVTQHEKRFPEDQKLISSTDKKGVIRHCNDAFVEVSGFSREELIGQAHNIIRHPDMPQAAFVNMWSYLKQGRPWMGLVKNRCKNGDYYWVHAYVTPVMDHGQIVGYESVRVCPSREQVQRADTLYRKINEGKSLSGLKDKVSLGSLIFGGTLLSVGGALLSGWPEAAAAVAMGGFAVHSMTGAMATKRIREDVAGLMKKSFMDPLAVRSYTDDAPELGAIKVAILSQKAHLDTVLTRIEDASSQVMDRTRMGLETMKSSITTLDQQQSETEQVATAMNEMSSTISEVSSHVQETALNAERTKELSVRSRGVVEDTRLAIAELKSQVDSIANSVRNLSEKAGGIASAAEMIEQIADQTNLLALNAAIEAARAGEHGRGFAVVAEEVRSLAKRTQQSTADIHEVVSTLIQGSQASVAVADQGVLSAEQGLEKMNITENMLKEMAEAIGDITDRAIQMAASVEEQAQVSEQINEQVVQISDLSELNRRNGDQTGTEMDQIGQVARGLNDLVVQFRQS